MRVVTATIIYADGRTLPLASAGIWAASWGRAEPA
jgi:hypothetical protein